MLPVKKYTITLAGNASQRLLVQGRFFKIVAETGTVTVLSDFGKLEDLIVGQGLEKTDFSYLLITDTSGASNTVTLLVGDENFVDAFSGNVALTANIQPKSGVFANVAATVTNASALLIAANAIRQYLLIQNRDATGSIYINFGAAATVANGIKIGPGATFELPGTVSTQAIYAIGDIASNANILTVQG